MEKRNEEFLVMIAECDEAYDKFESCTDELISVNTKLGDEGEEDLETGNAQFEQMSVQSLKGLGVSNLGDFILTHMALCALDEKTTLEFESKRAQRSLLLMHWCPL